MKITIRQPLAFSEIGRKDNQEDALFPAPAGVSREQRVFLMCDGMGGHEHGEVASNTVAETMGNALTASDNPRRDFQQALSRAYDALDAKDTDDGGKKMGTTMTCLILDDDGAVIAHIGDSRVYHIRPATGLKFQTEDHSLVNDLYRAGELTEEQRDNYPHKNIITRAMQPHLDRRSKADVYQQTDIRAGDYFFLCCDGVLEQLTNQRLCEILTMTISDTDKMTLIKAECDGKTKDNYTAWLIPVDQVEGSAADEEEEDMIQAESEDSLPTPDPTHHYPVRQSSVPAHDYPLHQPSAPARPDYQPSTNDPSTWKRLIEILVIVVAICCVGWLGYQWMQNDDLPDDEQVVPDTIGEQDSMVTPDPSESSWKQMLRGFFSSKATEPEPEVPEIEEEMSGNSASEIIESIQHDETAAGRETIEQNDSSEQQSDRNL